MTDPWPDELLSRYEAALASHLGPNTAEEVETLPGAYCETCDRNITDEPRTSHTNHEVIDYLYGIVDDPIAHVLSKHWASPITFDDHAVLCRCLARFDGPVYHRNHIADKIREALRAVVAGDPIPGFDDEETR